MFYYKALSFVSNIVLFDNLQNWVCFPIKSLYKEYYHRKNTHYWMFEAILIYISVGESLED